MIFIEDSFCFYATLRFMGTNPKPKIVVIVGPTSSGKTSLSLELAKQYNGEVINADSRQVYKGLDIGTEKITQEEMDGVPHHLLDVAEIDEVYSAKRFQEDADSAIDNILSEKKLPIIAGGTFFYIDTLLRKVSAPDIAPDFVLREELEKRETQELYQELLEKDPIRAEAVDKSNKRRIMRALEILHVLPFVPKLVPQENPYHTLILGIAVDKKVLRQRLRARAEKALARGLIEETQGLLEKGISRERLSEIGLEYRLVLEFIDGTTTKDQFIQKLEDKNWQYAKRQLVWLKRDSSILWFERDNTKAIFETITQFLAN